MRLQENGRVDGCQESEAQEDNPKVCDNCLCKRGFHERLADNAPGNGQSQRPPAQASEAVVAQTGHVSGPVGSQPGAAAEGQSSADVQPLKRARTGPTLDEGGQVFTEQKGRQ